MEEITLRDAYLILRRYRWLTLGLPIILAALTFAYTRLLTPAEYRAEATLSVQPSPIQSNLEDKIQATATPSVSTDEIEKVALSRTVLQSTYDQLKATGGEWASDNLDAEGLAGHFKISFARPASVNPGTSSSLLINLAASAATGDAAAQAANIWASKTLEAINRLPGDRIQSTFKAMQRAVEQADSKRSGIEQAYRNLIAQSSLESDQARFETGIGTRAKLETDLLEARTDLAQSTAALNQQRSNARSARGAELQRLSSAINDLNAEVAQYSARITALQTAILTSDTALTTLRSRVANGKIQIERVQSQLELSQNESKALQQKLADLRIEEVSARALAQVLTPAFASSRKANNATVAVALAAMLGLVFGLVLPFMLDAVRDPARVTATDDG
jgi:uncharacterized protein involved in exopolysaccharide biosynthesis